MWGICQTEGCGNQGHPVDFGELTWTDAETGQPVTATAVCGHEITSLHDTAPAPPAEDEAPEG